MSETQTPAVTNTITTPAVQSIETPPKPVLKNEKPEVRDAPARKVYRSNKLQYNSTPPAPQELRSPAPVVPEVAVDKAATDQTVSSTESQSDAIDAKSETDQTDKSKDVEAASDKPENLSNKDLMVRTQKLIKQEQELSQKKQRLSEEREKLKTDANKLVELEKEFEADPLSAISKYLPNKPILQNLAKQDPVKFLAKLGVSSEDYVAKLFGTNKNDVASILPKGATNTEETNTAVSKELEEMRQIRKEAEESRKVREQEEQQKAINNYVSDLKTNQISPLLTSNKDQYKLLLKLSGDNASQLVYETMEGLYDIQAKIFGRGKVPQDKMPTPKQAADTLEKYYQKQAEQYRDSPTPADTNKTVVATASPPKKLKEDKPVAHYDTIRNKTAPSYKVKNLL